MLAEQVLKTARAQNIKIATAESCTGGMVAAALTDISGSSDVFERGFITYSNAAKSEILGVSPALITAHGAVSRHVAIAMAERCLACAPAQMAISVTGVAGPGGGSPQKPVGTVHFAVAQLGKPTLHHKAAFGPLSRSEIRVQSVIMALQLCLDQLHKPQ